MPSAAASILAAAAMSAALGLAGVNINENFSSGGFVRDWTHDSFGPGTCSVVSKKLVFRNLTSNGAASGAVFFLNGVTLNFTQSWSVSCDIKLGSATDVSSSPYGIVGMGVTMDPDATIADIISNETIILNGCGGAVEYFGHNTMLKQTLAVLVGGEPAEDPVTHQNMRASNTTTSTSIKCSFAYDAAKDKLKAQVGNLKQTVNGFAGKMTSIYGTGLAPSIVIGAYGTGFKGQNTASFDNIKISGLGVVLIP